MDDLQRRIQEDLQGIIHGELRFDPVTLALYATDGSIYQIWPIGVLRPRNRDDVVTVLQYAAENHIPVIPRGAGTGVAGESLGQGLVLDFSRYMRRVVAVGEDTVRVQPGIVCDRLNAHLAARGRKIGPDPAGSACTTVGSMVALDAAGSHTLRYGSTRDHVTSIEAVRAGAPVFEAGREPVSVPVVSSSSDAKAGPIDTSGHDRRAGASADSLWGLGGNGLDAKRDLVGQVADLLRRNRELIQRKQPRSPRNRCGYLLAGVWDDHHVDLAKLLCGSEGTLAVFTEITLRTVPIPDFRGAVLLLFDEISAAARAVLEILPLGPSACDLLDRRLLSLARETHPALSQLIPQRAEAALMVEAEGTDPVEVRDRVRVITNRIRRRKQLAFEAREAFDPETVELFWNLPRTVVPMLYRMKGPARPVPFVEDMTVPPEVLPGFLVRLQNTLKRHQVTASLFAHAGHGQLHCRPFLDLSRPGDVRTLHRLATELYEEVFQVGGSISGEHGDGLVRTPFVRRQYGELYQVFQEVKRIFDPHNLLNPGKILNDDPDLMLRHLRPAEPAPTEVVPLRLDWSAEALSDAARRCNGCGACRTQQLPERMCPIFRIAPAEEASPRAKANLARHLLEGRLDPSVWESDALKAVADLCVHCKMCRLECPAGVDIPKLVLEMKGAHVAANGLRWADWVLSRADRWAALGSLTSLGANWIMNNRLARWGLEKLFGIAQHRKMPRFAPRSFMRWAARRGLTQRRRAADPRVAYFVDTYANYCDPRVGQALVAILRHHGITVHVPAEQRSAGMPLLAVGDVESAADRARHNVRVLADLVREGYTVICTEPTAAVCLTQEYPSLIDDPDAQLVAQQTQEAGQFLWQLHQAGRLRRDFSPLPFVAGYHTPCHLKALEVGTPGQQLLRLIPALRVPTIDLGCSGMAGTYGMKSEDFRNSLRAGWSLICRMREPDLHFGTTECSTCKLQMEQGTTKPTLHPLKLLALAYGLMPEVRQQLSAQSGELLAT